MASMRDSTPASLSPPPSALPSWVYRVPLLGRVVSHPILNGLLSSYFWMAVVLLIAEVALNGLIIKKVPYTEIDWEAYMAEVKPPLEDGVYNYSLLRGKTGPLVYPGGFVWLYGAIRHATESGTNILRAQVAEKLTKIQILTSLQPHAPPVNPYVVFLPPAKILTTMSGEKINKK
jgi:hypothetical protein